MSAKSIPDTGSGSTPTAQDRESVRWVEQLRVGNPRRDDAIAKLHDLLLRIASHELSRRRARLGSVSGPEFDDLAHQAADDALVGILARIDEFRGLSRFTTWAYKFVIFEVSGKVARHAWHRQPPSVEEPCWDRISGERALLPEEGFEQRERLRALSNAIADLSERQREVFVAVALNDVSIEVLAIRLRSNRNAIYKNLFDARRSLRASMAAAGHPVSGGTGAG